ncbi:molybdopterin-binding protein [Chloroflexota bacterium]
MKRAVCRARDGAMLKKVKLDEAIGMVLGHDMTKVIPGKYKGAAFRRGHVVREEDIPELLSMGKEHIYILEPESDEVHEEEAALRIGRAVAGPGLELTEPREGKVTIKAGSFGLLKVDVSLLGRINAIGDIILATVHNNTVCRPGDMVAGTRVTPLYTSEGQIARVEEFCRERGVLEIIPFEAKRVGVVIVGNEVFSGRIEDRFGEVIAAKVAGFGSSVSAKTVVPDNIDLVAQAITGMKDGGCEVIVACGGMSVDPDDVTVEGVEKAGAEIVSYGAPVLPGSMLLYARLGEIPVLGVPACVLHDPATIFDLVLPRVMAGDDLSREDIIKLGHGGLCLRCEDCDFPICPFGK